MADRVSHDQNFKNLVVDYPREALAFFAPGEAPRAGEPTRIVPVREEQLKDHLGDRFRRLDAPLLVEWEDGRREAVLFAVEEETDPRRFSPHAWCNIASALFMRGVTPRAPRLKALP